MADRTFREILMLCKSFEQSATETYRAISEVTESDEQKAFWHDVSEDEKRHITYWEHLLALEEQGILPNPFDKLKETKAELQAMKLSIDRLLLDTHDGDILGTMLVTFRLESFMLNPAFTILFRALKDKTDAQSPEDDYQEHLEKFSRFVKQFIRNKPELELISEIIFNMWKHSRELATQFSEIKVLRGFIPICASCKKVRDDQGYWNQIETYISKRSEAKFSHGICPECAKKIYPGLVGNRTEDSTPG